jgi:hypothetical protein
MPKLRFNSGSTSVAFLGMVVFLIALSIVLVSGVGYVPSSYNNDGSGATPIQTGSSQIIVTQTPPPGIQNLQLRTFGMITIAPSPTPHAEHGCTQKDTFNDETIILLGSAPGPGGSVGRGGQVRVWVVDERAPKVAAGETLTATGQTVHSAQVGASSGGPYIWEPSIYLTKMPATPVRTLGSGREIFAGDAENGGTPNYPDFIKGEYSNDPSSDSVRIAAPQPIDQDYRLFENGPDYQSRPPVEPIPDLSQKDWKYAAEYIWDVDNLKLGGIPLSPGSYRAQFVIHDGDDNMGIDCTTITIQ